MHAAGGVPSLRGNIAPWRNVPSPPTLIEPTMAPPSANNGPSAASASWQQTGTGYSANASLRGSLSPNQASSYRPYPAMSSPTHQLASTPHTHHLPAGAGQYTTTSSASIDRVSWEKRTGGQLGTLVTGTMMTRGSIASYKTLAPHLRPQTAPVTRRAAGPPPHQTNSTSTAAIDMASWSDRMAVAGTLDATLFSQTRGVNSPNTTQRPRNVIMEVPQPAGQGGMGYTSAIINASSTMASDMQSWTRRMADQGTARGPGGGLPYAMTGRPRPTTAAPSYRKAAAAPKFNTTSTASIDMASWEQRLATAH